MLTALRRLAIAARRVVVVVVSFTRPVHSVSVAGQVTVHVTKPLPWVGGERTSSGGRRPACSGGAPWPWPGGVVCGPLPNDGGLTPTIVPTARPAPIVTFCGAVS